MSRLNISFLGTFQVLLDRQPITHFRSTNIQGLLAYLLLQGKKPLSRELLAALFWPDEPEQIARNNLRQSLFRLRQLLGDMDEPVQPYLLVTWRTVQFNPDSDFGLDVQQFLQAVDVADLATAVAILSMITHHDEANAYHQQLIGEALPQIKVEMGDAAFAAAWEEGKVMDFDTAVSLIRTYLSASDL